MKRKLLIIITVVMLFTNFVYADGENEKIEMENYRAEWGLGVKVNNDEKEFILLKGEEEIEKAEKNNIYTFDGVEINVEIPKEFYLGQAGLISANTSLNGFVRIINNNTKDIKIEQTMRLFERESIERKNVFCNNDELINQGSKFKFTNFLDTTGEEIFFKTNSGKRQYGNTITGYFLLIPQNTGKFSITIEVGENDEIYDRKEIEIEVKEAPKGVSYSYKINPELSQEILIRFRNTWREDVPFLDSNSLGKIDEELYLEIDKSENVKSKHEGRIELKNKEGYVIFDENSSKDGFITIDQIEMNPQEESEITIMLTYPAWFDIAGGGGLTGRPNSKSNIGVDLWVSLNPKLNFKNTITSNNQNKILEKTSLNNPTATPKSKKPIILSLTGIGISTILLLILLDMKKLKISLIKNESDLISIVRKGGRKEFINTKIRFLIEKENEIIEKTVEMEMATGEVKNINNILNEIKEDDEEILEIIVITENDKNYSDKYKLIFQ